MRQTHYIVFRYGSDKMSVHTGKRRTDMTLSGRWSMGPLTAYAVGASVISKMAGTSLSRDCVATLLVYPGGVS